MAEENEGYCVKSKAKRVNRTNAVSAMVIFEPIWIPQDLPDPRADVPTLRKQAQEACRIAGQRVHEIERHGYGIYRLIEKLNAEF